MSGIGNWIPTKALANIETMTREPVAIAQVFLLEIITLLTATTTVRVITKL